MLPIHTILHPTDFSEHARHAFQMACTLAQSYGARLIVMHVAVPPVAFYGEGLVEPPPATFKAQLRAKLDDIKPANPSVRIVRSLVEGDPAIEILRMAKEVNCDLIMMGTHGRTGLGRFILGSVAEQVVRKAPCPVLTLKVPRQQFQIEDDAAAPVLAGRGAEDAK